MPRSSKTTAPDALVPVMFKLPAIDAQTVAICGEFNNWTTDTTHLEHAPDGSWSASVDLEPGRSYRYRYLLDGTNWENDWEPDAYEPNAYGGHDSVVVVPAALPAGPPKRISRARTPAPPQDSPKRISRARTDAAA
jgi:1,4-alpha-glucan branching enzyme